MAHDKSGNKKHFCSYVKKKTKSRAGVGPIANAAGSLLSGEVDMAGELNRYFGSVFMREDTTHIPDPPPMRTRLKLTNCFITHRKSGKKSKA